jgi:hypothetical protein
MFAINHVIPIVLWLRNKYSIFLFFFQSIGIRSVPFRAPPPLLPSARKTGSSSGEKGISLSEGLGKEYMKWRKMSVGKTGAQAEERHVVIRASQG